MSGNDSSNNDQSRLPPSKRSLEDSDEIIETCKMGKTAAAGIGPALESFRQNEDFLSTPEGLPFTKNREFFLAALLDQLSGTTSRTIFPRMSPELLNQKHFLLLAIDLKRREDILLQHVSERMQNDQDVVHKAVVKNGQELQFASTALKENKEFIVNLFSEVEYDYVKHVLQHMCATLWEDDDILQRTWDCLYFEDLLDIMITLSPKLSKIAWLKMLNIAPSMIYQLPKRFEMDVDLLAVVPVEVLAEKISWFPKRAPSYLPHHYKDRTIIKQVIVESWSLNDDGTMFPKKGEEDDLEFVKAVAESEYYDHLVHPDMDGVSSRIQTILRLEHDPSIFHQLDEALRDDIEVADAACKNQSDNIRHASERIQTHYQLREDPASFASLEEDFRGDSDLAKAAVRQNQTMIAHVKPELLADKEFFWSILKDRPGLYSRASSTLKNDRYFNFRSVCLNPSVFLQLPESVRKDKAILRSITGRKPIQAEEVAKHVVPEFWADERFMEEILCSMPSILEFLPHECRSNKNLVMLGGTKTIALANPELWDDHDFVRKIADKYPKELTWCSPDHVLQDRYVLIRAACQDPKNVLQKPVAGPSLVDRSFVEELLAKRPRALQFLPERWKEDKGLIQRYPKTFEYASHKVKSDKVLILSMLKADAKARGYDAYIIFRFAESSVWDDASFVKRLVEVTESATVFGFMSNSQRIALFADRTFAVFASESCKRGDLLTHLPRGLRNDLEVMTNVLSNHAYSGSLSHDLLSQTGLAVVNNVGFIAACIEKVSYYNRNKFWRHVGSNLKARIKSTSDGLLRYFQMKRRSQEDPLPRIWLRSLNHVQRYADTHLRSFSFEIFRAQSGALEKLPAEVVATIHSFLDKNGTANRAFVESQQEAAQALEYCGPIFVALTKKGIYWRKVQQCMK